MALANTARPLHTLLILWAVFAPYAASSALEADARLTVHLQDAARIGATAITPAAEEAARIFEAAGVTTTWIDQPRADNPDESAMNVTVVLLDRVKSATMISALKLGPSVLGTADVPSRCAYVFYERIVEQTAWTNTESLLLGKVIAHEVGHLLLDPGHSRSGIMQARIYPQWVDLFTPQQARALQSLLAQSRDSRGED
jgi:hypothetical protein